VGLTGRVLVGPFFAKNEVGINCIDFCHDSAKQARLMALAAPKVEKSWKFWSNCVNNRIKFAVC
jgi:hypothetical protein